MINDYFAFLRFSLDDSMQTADCAERIVWHELLEFAKKQSLVGVFFHGIRRMKNVKNRPSDDDIMEWYFHVNRIEERNRLMNEKSALVVRNFKIEGFRSCILKGQGNALMYADPLMRQPGDIDVWVEGKDRRIIEYVRDICPKAKAVYHHIEFNKLKGVEVEVHYRPSFMNNMIANHYLQQYFKTEADRQFCNFSELPEDKGQICVPTDDFNRIFQMSHISNHFFHEGIGLRQLVDYYILLKKGMTDEEKEREQRLLYRCGMLKIAKAVMYVLKEVLGLEENYMIVAPDKRRGRKLLNEILKGGNFGQHDNRVGHDVHANALVKNIQRIYRDTRMALLFPSESLWEPVFRLYHFFWRIRLRVTK